MITFQVILEQKLDHTVLLFQSSSIVTAWKEWCDYWKEKLMNGI